MVDPSERAPSLSTIVLAAGDGKRLRSSRPKVIHEAGGRPLLAHVLDACAPLVSNVTVVVASPRVNEIKTALGSAGSGTGVTFVVQDPPRGTADAVKVALAAVPEEDAVLVLPGDVPLIQTPDLQELVSSFSNSGAAALMLTADVADPSGYGRVIRQGDAVEAIVEERDATDEQRAVREVNSGIYIFEREPLVRMLDKVDDRNAQGELYLTDVIGLLTSDGLEVIARKGDPEVVRGVNSRAQLWEVGVALRRRASRRWMDAGVTIVDPETTFIDAGVEIEPDATILPFTFLQGRSIVRSGAEVGPQCRIIDSEIGPDAQVSYAVVRDSVVGPEATVGPFASLRAGTVVGRGARAGTFVETKNTTIGEGSKVPHLSYMGDAEIGRRVNVGAGTITCNWDGREKHPTKIDDDVYVGSDSMLVAPVHLKARSATGAGAVVRGEVPEDALAVGVPARVIEGRGNRVQRSGSGDAGKLEGDPGSSPRADEEE